MNHRDTEKHRAITVALITDSFARDILAWRYEPPYDFYDVLVLPETLDAELAYVLAPENRFHQIERGGELAAFCSFGVDCRVPGGEYDETALDMGLGVRPDMTGRGLGGDFARAVVGYAKATYAPAAMRVTVAAFNRRALRVWTTLGFREVSRFEAEKTRVPFVILLRQG